MQDKSDAISKLVPIVVSLFALLVSAISLGWNIYRDIVLKARVRVSFALSQLIGGALPKPLDTLSLEGTNFGPGAVTCTAIHLKVAPLWRRLFRQTKHAVLIHDYENPLSAKLPKKLEVGEKINLFIRWEKDCFLSEDITHIGIADTFGRIHWAPTSEIKDARQKYQEKFGQTKKNGAAPA